MAREGRIRVYPDEAAALKRVRDEVFQDSALPLGHVLRKVCEDYERRYRHDRQEVQL